MTIILKNKNKQENYVQFCKKKYFFVKLHFDYIRNHKEDSKHMMNYFLQIWVKCEKIFEFVMFLKWHSRWPSVPKNKKQKKRELYNHSIITFFRQGFVHFSHKSGKISNSINHLTFCQKSHIFEILTKCRALNTIPSFWRVAMT